MGDSVAKDAGDGQPIDKIVKPPDGIKHRILSETPPEKLVESMRESMNYMEPSSSLTSSAVKPAFKRGLPMFLA